MSKNMPMGISPTFNLYPVWSELAGQQWWVRHTTDSFRPRDADTSSSYTNHVFTSSVGAETIEWSQAAQGESRLFILPINTLTQFMTFKTSTTRLFIQHIFKVEHIEEELYFARFIVS